MKAQLLEWMRRKWRWLAAAAGLLIVYTLLGFLWVPYFARSTIVDYVRNQLHRQIEIGRVTFNPFTLTARVERFELKEADGAPVARFDGLLVNAELFSSIIHRGGTFKEITIDNPSVLLHVDADGSFNLAKLKAPAAPQTATAKDESELPHIRIGRFTLRGGKVTIEDFSHPKPFTATLAPIEFSLVDFRTEPKFGNAYRFVASTEEDETLEWAGEFSVQPLGSRGRFALENIKATTIASYLQDTLPFDMPLGQLDLQGEYRLAFADRIDFKVKLPTIKARNFALAPHANEESAPWITLPELSIVGTSFSLVDRSLSIDDVQIIEPIVEAWRTPEGGVNLTQLFSGRRNSAADNTPSPAPPTQAAAPPSWKVGVKNIQVESGHINAEDRGVTPNAKLALTPISIKIANYSNEPNSKLAIDASIGVNEQGVVTASGPLSLSPLDANLKIAVKDFDLAPLQPYVAQVTDMTLKGGQLAVQTELRYSAQPARNQPPLKFTGDIEVTNLVTKDNALEQDFIKWQSLKIAGLNYQQGPDRLTIASIRARKPYARVIIASNGATNVTQVLNPKHAANAGAASAAAKQSAKESKQVFPVRIRSVVVEDGSASFADYSINPSFSSEIGGLKGSIDGLSSERDSRAKVDLSGRVDRYAPVSITGEVNFLATDVYTDVAMNFRNIELTTFNPYSGKFAGYNITKGKLSTEMQYKVENRKLDARHHIVIDQLEFGAATNSKDAVSLPVKLAVALLKDRHGVINLDLPIGGSLDDPTFRVGPIIWQVLKNTLEKIVTAPFALLGSLFGGGEELAYVDFAHGSAKLSPEAAEKLDKLKRAMVERPQLKLDIPLQATDEADKTTLARATLDQTLAPLLTKKPDRLAALTTTYSKEFGKQPSFPKEQGKKEDVEAEKIRYLETALMEKYTPTAAQLESLGRERGTAVRDALLAGGEIEAEHVFLSGRGSEPSKDKGAARMELKLE